MLISFDGQEEEIVLNEVYTPFTLDFTVYNPNSTIDFSVKNMNVYNQSEQIG